MRAGDRANVGGARELMRAEGRANEGGTES